MPHVDTPSITSLTDLKAALVLPTWIETVQDQARWLPNLVQSLAWETHLSEHFVLHLHVEAPKGRHLLFDNFLAESEEIYAQLVTFFELKAHSKIDELIEQGRLTYFIVQTQSLRTFGGLTDPHLLFYLCDLQNDPEFMTRIRHELAHWTWSRRFGEAARLFQEGIAVYAELMSAPSSTHAAFLRQTPFSRETLMPLRQLVVNENFWNYDDAYRVAGRWVAFLVEQWGWTPLKELFLRTDYEDAHVLEHFQQIYGEPIEAVEQEWLQSIG